MNESKEFRATLPPAELHVAEDVFQWPSYVLLRFLNLIYLRATLLMRSERGQAPCLVWRFDALDLRILHLFYFGFLLLGLIAF